MKKKLEINVKKIMMFYMVGYISAFLIPQQYFFQLMNTVNKRINDKTVIEDKGDFYKIN